MSSDFEAVIGLEVHCQLSTETKIFCGCRARLPVGHSVADVAPNSHTCPVCTGQPGALPVLNKKAVEFAVRAGLSTQCRINRTNIFARKNYFYPDLPKGYQISQYELPICAEGVLEIELASGDKKKIQIQRMHLEEDAGKNVHHSGYSVVNLNRAGVPLLEIVSGPDLRTSEEAGAYLRALYEIVTYLGICDGNLQEGNFRCDANVSVRRRGDEKFGTRVEIKNINSFRFVEKAIDFEIHRQIGVVTSGSKVIQETRTYDSDKDHTTSMRSKEEAEDYRYFPDPDLRPVRVHEAMIGAVQAAMPELPAQKRARYAHAWGLSRDESQVLTQAQSIAHFFERTVAVLLNNGGMDPKTAAKQASNWVSGEVLRLMREHGEGSVTPESLAHLIGQVARQAISGSAGKQVLALIWKSDETVDAVISREGLAQVSDEAALNPEVDRILAANPAQVAEFRAGKEKVLGFFVGQVMKATGGKANPVLLQQLVKKKLKGESP